MNDELVAFVTARLDDDERFVRVMVTAGQRNADNATAADMADALGMMMTIMADPDARAEMEHWLDSKTTPPTGTDRVLRDIEAKRRVLAAYADCVDASGFFREKLGTGTHMAAAAESYANFIRWDAAAWSDHPDYREEWKP